MKSKFICLTAFLLLLATAAQAQYFGRNKPRYQKQDFKVTQTNHFEIYEYLDNPEKKKELAEAAELWYSMHSAVLRDSFTRLNPLLIYNDHAGFQQTNAIQGDIQVGTGGVTEGLRNRVVFPIAPTNQQTSHVLGHEMVHAFQYHMILEGDSTSMQNLANLPLWMIEGLAEYLSIGRIDPQTSLWMRDAVLHNKLPKNLRALDSGKYFPYRWGQSFWAYVAGRYGDEAIRPYFVNTAKYGIEASTRFTLGITTDQLAQDWTNALRENYGAWLQKKRPPGAPAEPERKGKDKDKKDDELAFGLQDPTPGKAILSDKNAGKMNICPVLSPNGKYVIYLTEKNLFTTDLYLADAKTGETIRKVSSTLTDGHIDQMNFIESAGTWSPDSKKFAFDAYEQGHSVLIIKNLFKGKKTERRTLPGVPSFNNPAWSPDGRTIVVCGLVNGQSDLYAYDVKTKKVRRLTNDPYSELHPTWSADGTRILYSTDELSLQRGRTNGAWKMNLATIDVASGTKEMIDVFPGADNMNPHYDKTGNVLFLSDRDGFRNLYRYAPATQKVEQLTDLLTGITGITPYAPALSVSDDRDRVVYTYYSDGEYVIYQAQMSDFSPKEVDASAVSQEAAALPPFNPRLRDQVNTNLRLMDNNAPSIANITTQKEVKYRPKFSLDYLGGGVGAGVITGNTSFGNNVGVAGGVTAVFSDVLGNNQIFAGAALNGDVQDISGQASYINQKNRLGWGVSASHFSFITSGGYLPLQAAQFELQGQVVNGYATGQQLDRIFNQRLGGLVFYPFSTTRRVEAYTSFDFYQQRSTQYLDYYVEDQGNLFYVYSDRIRLPRVPQFNFQLGNIGTALVGDNSFFGFTAPLQGWRYRLGVEQSLVLDPNSGDSQEKSSTFTSLLADGRYYKRVKPFTFAVRGLSYLRLGDGAQSVFPLFVAQPWFVRGYENQGLYQNDPTLINRISGSKLAVFNAEIRLPFTGPRGLAVIPTRAFLSDLNLFFDAGAAFGKIGGELTEPDIQPIYSAGVSLRVNLFGYLVLEPYFATPLSVAKDQRGWRFGLNFQPGW